MKNNFVVVGAPIQTEINGKRFYRVNFEDGSFKLLRSVTSICKGARLPSYLDEWQMQQAEALGVVGFKAALQQSADDGTSLHKVIEDHIAGKKTEIHDEDIQRMFDGYLAWETKAKPKWLWTEKALYSLKNGYAGRCDGKAIIGGKITIVDFKSSKKAQPEHKEQVSAYLMADGEMSKDSRAECCLILPLGSEAQQGFSETWLDNPYDIAQHFMSFQLKNALVSFHNPSL